MKKVSPFLIVFVLSLAAIRPLFTQGYFPMHDDTQVSRVIVMGNALSEGQFPVRMVSDLGYGYGYPIFNFYGPLPYYFGGTLYALGVPALTATKLMFAFGIILPAITMYLVVSSLAGWQAAFAAALLYMYAPYHAVEIYVRGAVGEYWALIFWPLILYAFTRDTNPKYRYIRMLSGVTGVAGVVLSHTLLGYATVLAICTGLAVFWLARVLSRSFDRRLFFSHIGVVLLGLGVSAFFWLPAVLEMGFTSVSGQVSTTANYADHFVCIGQLWSSLWGFGGSAPGCLDGMSFVLGKLHVLVALAALLGFFFRRRQAKHVLFWAGLLVSIPAVFLVTSYSAFLWQTLPGFAYMQYPWRFLSAAAFGLALLGGAAVTLVKDRRLQSAGALCIGVSVLLFNLKWFAPQYTYEKTSKEFESMSDLRWRASKVSDEYLPPAVIRPAAESAVVFDTIQSSPAVSVISQNETAVRGSFVLQAAGAADVTVNKAYIPGWTYVLNAVPVHPRIENGLPVIHLEAGQSLLEMRFTDTFVRTAGNIISLASLVYVGVLFYEKQRKAKR